MRDIKRADGCVYRIRSKKKWPCTTWSKELYKQQLGCVTVWPSSSQIEWRDYAIIYYIVRYQTWPHHSCLVMNRHSFSFQILHSTIKHISHRPSHQQTSNEANQETQDVQCWTSSLTRFTSYIKSTMCITRINVTIIHTQSVCMNADQWNVARDSVNQLEHWYNSETLMRHRQHTPSGEWKAEMDAVLVLAKPDGMMDGLFSKLDANPISPVFFLNIVRCICISVTYKLYVWVVDI